MVKACTLASLLFGYASSFAPIPTWQSQSSHGTARCMAAADLDQEVQVMVNGMPGPMATAAAEACLRKGLNLAPVAMTGPNVEPCTIQVYDVVSGKSAQVKLIPSSQSDRIDSAIAGMKEASDMLLAIDYTHPSAVNENAKFYVSRSIPFVMGTTGGDRDALLRDVEGAFAVIAPNMGKQIVAMQSALEELAEKFPAAFAGYDLKVRESHQKTKADTSGTAKAVIESLKVLTNNQEFEADKDVDKVRDDLASMDFGVPQDALSGHAFHTYTLTSPDGTVEFELKHNVVGRSVYAEGTADAVKFLAKKIAEGQDAPQIYTMINVLEEGALE
jgi:4-hydroxy-tetrahydrodipicolinate reductase